MNNIDNFGFLDRCGEASKINKLDCFLFGKKQSILMFIRDKRRLHFRTSPTKDTFRHVDFIRSEDDFKLLSLLVSQIFGLGGCLKENHKDYYLWEFSKEINIPRKVILNPYMIFSPREKKLSIHQKGRREEIFSSTLNLENDNDFFQCANFLASLMNRVARTIPSSKDEIAYHFLEI